MCAKYKAHRQSERAREHYAGRLQEKSWKAWHQRTVVSRSCCQAVADVVHASNVHSHKLIVASTFYGWRSVIQRGIFASERRHQWLLFGQWRQRAQRRRRLLRLMAMLRRIYLLAAGDFYFSLWRRNAGQKQRIATWFHQQRCQRRIFQHWRRRQLGLSSGVK